MVFAPLQSINNFRLNVVNAYKSAGKRVEYLI